MIYKRVKLGEFSMIPESPDMFTKGTKFLFGGKVGTVRECMIGDNAEMRKVGYDDGSEEIVTLQTLLKDSQTPGFAMVEDDEEEK